LTEELQSGCAQSQSQPEFLPAHTIPGHQKHGYIATRNHQHHADHRHQHQQRFLVALPQVLDAAHGREEKLNRLRLRVRLDAGRGQRALVDGIQLRQRPLLADPWLQSPNHQQESQVGSP